jgi:hypothetical protein
MSRQVYASASIYSETVSPVDVSRLVELECDRSVIIGEKLREEVFAQQNAWIYTTKDKLDSENLEEHITLLLDRLNAAQTSLEKLSNSGDCWMRILCFWESLNANGGPTLTKNIIRRLAEYPFDIEFDVWFS